MVLLSHHSGEVTDSGNFYSKEFAFCGRLLKEALSRTGGGYQEGDEQQKHGAETRARLAIRITFHRLLKLGGRTGFGIGKLERTRDLPIFDRAYLLGQPCLDQAGLPLGGQRGTRPHGPASSRQPGSIHRGRDHQSGAKEVTNESMQRHHVRTDWRVFI
jgi:hypothetical protein